MINGGGWMAAVMLKLVMQICWSRLAVFPPETAVGPVAAVVASAGEATKVNADVAVVSTGDIPVVVTPDF